VPQEWLNGHPLVAHAPIGGLVRRTIMRASPRFCPNRVLGSVSVRATVCFIRATMTGPRRIATRALTEGPSRFRVHEISIDVPYSRSVDSESRRPWCNPAHFRSRCTLTRGDDAHGKLRAEQLLARCRDAGRRTRRYDALVTRWGQELAVRGLPSINALEVRTRS